MKNSLRLSAYGAALAVLVAGTYVVGAAVGPVSDGSPSVSAPVMFFDFQVGGVVRTADFTVATIGRPA